MSYLYKQTSKIDANKPWTKMRVTIKDSLVIEDIKNASEVVLICAWSSFVYLNRDINIAPKGFFYYSTGQRYGSAVYQVDFDSGKISITNQYANADWNAIDSNAIVMVFYR